MSAALPSLSIRSERAEDAGAVARVVEAAFERPDEARLIEALRPLRPECISLVALVGDELLGHILFTRVDVRSPEGDWQALGLAPVSVDPAHQGAGLGSALVRAGLGRCADAGEDVVFVLGHAAYYPRFGFRPAGPLGLHYRSPVFDPSFFVAELRDGALAGRRGHVEYQPAFEGL
jgi:putative acetyltransferase